MADPLITFVVGLNWGDEGKGKTIHHLISNEQFRYCIRANGGSNAGHSIEYLGSRFALHQVPTGLISPEMIGIIGPGCVTNLEKLDQEIQDLYSRGINIDDRLFISNRSHLVMPYHCDIDRLLEKRLGDRRIGTTSQGIGPAYADKAYRRGITAGDLLDEEVFLQKITRNLEIFEQQFPDNDGDYSVEWFMTVYRPNLIQKFRPMITHTSNITRHAIQSGEKILVEGANGTLLDIDGGNYPYVTSSGTILSALMKGADIPGNISSRYPTRVIGVVKAYATRVGEGPFPTELKDGVGNRLQEIGQEFGATTKRKRRCGWFDAVATGHAIWENGCDQLWVTKLDVLSELGESEIPIAINYQDPKGLSDSFPSSSKELGKVKPYYEYAPGWNGKLGQNFDDWPKEAQQYIRRLRSILGVPITYAGIGPGCDDITVIPE